MSVADRITAKLEAAFRPERLEVVDQSNPCRGTNTYWETPKGGKKVG